MEMRDTSVSLSGVRLDNPVIPASGCFGFGYVMSEYYDLEILGSISIKGTTLSPRAGNPLPRVAECPEGLINSVGLQNPGVHKVVSEELPKLRKVFHKPVVANISGFSIDEYVEACRVIDGAEEVGIIELNVSCPNVHGGGMSFGTQPKSVAEVVKAVKEVVTKPLYVKLTPNVTDIVKIENRHQDTPSGCRQQSWRFFWAGDFPRCRKNDLAGCLCGEHSYYRMRRSIDSGQCDRDDDGGCHGSGGRFCEPC